MNKLFTAVTLGALIAGPVWSNPRTPSASTRRASA